MIFKEIYVAGCLQPLRALFDAHALHIGMAVVAIIVPVVKFLDYAK
jgi:hypothetical protein